MEKISVIIPVYNRVDVLERCVRSVQRQNGSELEIILCDDGSDDGSTELCYALAEKDRRICVSHIVHSGASAARNIGLLRASGDYLYFLDSDDVIAPGMLRRMWENIADTGAELSCCRFRLEEGGGEFVPSEGELSVLPPKEAFEKMLVNEGNLGYGVSTGTKLIKRSLILEPFPLTFPGELVFGEDTVWTAKLLERASRVAMDSAVMMRYSLDCANSVCRNISVYERLRHTRWKLRYLKENGFSDPVIEIIRQEEKYLITRILLGTRGKEYE